MRRSYTVDIDIGGTLTDGLFSDGVRVWTVKVDTTPHDFTVCFFDCLREGAIRIGVDDLASFLEQVSVVRWSTTIATNVLAERKGPRIGLLVTAGHEEDFYGDGRSPALGYLIDRDNVASSDDPSSKEEVLEAIRSLLERGVRRICVSLRDAFEDDSAERAIKRIVDNNFPDHYLGAVPTLLGSEICRHPDDRTRTHIALINAYVHTPLAVSLFKAEDELLAEYRYRRPIYIAHVNGGVARVAKTKGVDTTESGPVFGLMASSYFARLYGIEDVISLDVGGTTAKVGVVSGGEPMLSATGDFLGIEVKTPSILLRSAPLGGGSVARVTDRRVTLGPDSMGAYPGPACYDLGGDNATLTDAFVVLGMLDPKRFLEGRRELNVERGREALRRNIADPLGDSVENAATRIIDAAVDIVEDTVRKALDSIGRDPSGYSLFCFGGNGGNLATLTAQRLGLGRAVVFNLGPVLSAFGSSVSAISHIYEEWPYLSVTDDEATKELEDFVVRGRERVGRDLEGEGLHPDEAQMSLELTVATEGGAGTTMIRADPADVPAALEQARAAGGKLLERAAVRGTFPVPIFDLRPAQKSAHTPSPQHRRSVLGAAAGVFDWDALRPGASVTGPAIIESGTNTVTVPASWTLSIDEYDNGILETTKGGE
jgi:N-methylhydantoinase A